MTGQHDREFLATLSGRLQTSPFELLETVELSKTRVPKRKPRPVLRSYEVWLLESEDSPYADR